MSVLETPVVLLHPFIRGVVLEISVFIHLFLVFPFTKVQLPTCMTINDHFVSNMRNGQHRTKTEKSLC